jgi:hypothetical protein
MALFDLHSEPDQSHAVAGSALREARRLRGGLVGKILWAKTQAWRQDLPKQGEMQVSMRTDSRRGRHRRR